jgi:hypothetical protein
LEEIRLLIKNELSDHFGIQKQDKSINKYVQKIWDWWVKNHNFKTRKPTNFCCERLRKSYQEGSIIYIYEYTSKIDETEWVIKDLWHIYYCPFCGAFIKGYGSGEYDDEYPPNKKPKILRQK